MGFINKKVDPEVRCPVCESDNIVREKFSPVMLAISMLLLGLPLAFIKGKYKCFDCYEKWKDNGR